LIAVRAASTEAVSGTSRTGFACRSTSTAGGDFEDGGGVCPAAECAGVS
jgi:hypothetical protein